MDNSALLKRADTGKGALAILAGVLALAAIASLFARAPYAGIGGKAGSAPSVFIGTAKQGVKPPLVAPSVETKPIPPVDAEAINAARPNDVAIGAAAAPFVLQRDDKTTWGNAVACLTSAIYYEAASEPLPGQQAVAQIVLNRVRHSAFPGSICGVVYQGWEQPNHCQFSFACDGSLRRAPSAKGWRIAQALAERALSGAVMKGVGLATQYHANYVVPYWSDEFVKTQTIGRHIFYRWPGAWGNPRAFFRPYAHVEVNPLNAEAVATVPGPMGNLPVQPSLKLPATAALTPRLVVDHAPKSTLVADGLNGLLLAKNATLTADQQPKLPIAPGATR